MGNCLCSRLTFLQRLKCDEDSPSCQRCLRRGIQCPGYSRPVRWSAKHEKHLIPTLEPINSNDAASKRFHLEAKKLGKVVDAGQNTMERAESLKGDDTETQVNSNAQEPDDSPPVLISSSSVDTVGKNELPERGTEELLNSIGEEGIVDAASDTADSCFQGRITLSLHVPQEQSSVLLSHYFDIVCKFNSSFDSEHNPFRGQVPEMMAQSPLVFYCVLSMSAAHYHRKDNANASPLVFQTEAVSYLSRELATTDYLAITSGDEARNMSVSTRLRGAKDELLLSTILLGMTSVSFLKLSVSNLTLLTFC